MRNLEVTGDAVLMEHLQEMLCVQQRGALCGEVYFYRVHTCRMFLRSFGPLEELEGQQVEADQHLRKVGVQSAMVWRPRSSAPSHPGSSTRLGAELRRSEDPEVGRARPRDRRRSL